ncbi:MAG: Bug family tripartite tricarboxylate transporter substrate binding protein [Pseudomonadales bacterium]
MERAEWLKLAMNFSPIRRRVLAGIGGLAITSMPVIAKAERRVRLIVPTSAGGATDLIARTLQPGFSKALGVPVIVENAPGASGLIGLQVVRRSSPADICLAVITNSLAILPSTMKAFPFDVEKEFTPIAMLATIPMAMAANPKLKAANAKELIAMLIASPEKLNFGSSGVGSVSHLSTEIFLEKAGMLKAGHIPFQGPGPMTAALIGDQVDFASQGLPVFHALFKSGTLVPIGVFSEKRTIASPDGPTMAEQGLSDSAVDAWVSVLGPKDIDKALVEEVSRGIQEAFGAKEAKEQLALQGAEVSLAGPEETKRIISRDIKRYAEVVKKVGLVPQ